MLRIRILAVLALATVVARWQAQLCWGRQYLNPLWPVALNVHDDDKRQDQLSLVLEYRVRNALYFTAGAARR